MTTETRSPLVPKLRFPEFQDAPEWTEGRCRDIAKVLPGYGFPENFQGNTNGQYPFYKVSDISQTIEKGQRYISGANNHIDADVLDAIRGKPVPAGTIIFAKIGEAIRSNRRVVTTKPAVVDNNTAGVKAKKGMSSDEFLFYLWSNVSLIDHAGGVVPAVSKSALENVPLCYPRDPEEQERVADCLGSLDDLIAAKGRKLEALRQHKQGLMQQLFPQPGETVPRLRFPEFQDAPQWEKPSLGEVCEMKAGDFVGASEIFDVQKDGFFPCYGGNGLRGFVKTATHDGLYVLVGRQGALCGNVNLFAGCFHATEHALVATPFSGIDTHWLYYALDMLKLNRFATGQAQPGLSVGVLNAVPVAVPANHDEQRRIADCLAALDDYIAAQANRLETIKCHKQGLLQQLFPSLQEES